MVIVTLTDVVNGINVMDYGADPANADNAGFIQAAINDAFTAGGGIVYVPATSSPLVVKSQLQVTSRVRLVGSSRGGSQIQADASFPINTALVRLGDGSGLVVGSRVEFMRLDCNSIAGSQGVMTTEANEECGVFDSVLVNHTDIGVYFNGSGAQNCGIERLEIYGSASGYNDNVYVNGSPGIYLDRITTHCNGAGTGTNGIHINGSPVTVLNCHGEKSTNGIYFDTTGSGIVIGYIGRSTVTNAINIASGNGGGITLRGISQNGSTNTINNQARSETITDSYVTDYAFANIGGGGGVLKNLVHTQNAPPWRVGAVIRAIQGITFGDGAAPIVTTGTGTPESVVTAHVGSVFLRSDGGASTTLYVKESGTGNTGWIAK